MNQTIESILGRRSVRSYRGDPVPEAELAAVIQAGLYAPSAKNTQAWHISCLTDRKRVDEIGT